MKDTQIHQILPDSGRANQENDERRWNQIQSDQAWEIGMPVQRNQVDSHRNQQVFEKEAASGLRGEKSG